MKAKLLRKLDSERADQRLYECEPGGELPRFVVVSAVVVEGNPIVDMTAIFCGDKYGRGAETFIFAADEAGEVTDWTDLPGSFKGELDHEKALRNAGYEPS